MEIGPEKLPKIYRTIIDGEIDYHLNTRGDKPRNVKISHDLYDQLRASSNTSEGELFYRGVLLKAT